MTALVIRGDARHLPLPDESVDLIVTSPPYFALRSYSDVLDCLECYEMRLNGRDPRQAWPDYAAHVRDVHERRHYPGQIGSEPTPQEFLEALWECTAEMMRVLKPSGSAFINLGDKYGRPGGGADVNPRSLAGAGKGATQRTRTATDGGGRDKCLMLLPERYRIGCVDRLGLIARAVIVLDKKNGLPESVTDRVRRSHEDVVHLTKQPRYYSAVDQIRELHAGEFLSSGARNARSKHNGILPHERDDQWRNVNDDRRDGGNVPGNRNPLGKLPGSVWEYISEPFQPPDYLGIDHFAAFATSLPKRLIRGWSPPGICLECGEGRRPIATATADYAAKLEASRRYRAQTQPGWGAYGGSQAGFKWHPGQKSGETSERTILGYVCACTPHTDHPGTGESSGADGRYGDALARGDGYPTAETNTNGKGLTSLQNRPRVGPWREYHFDRWTPAPTRPAIVLDPCGGTGTTALVASALGRIGITNDLSFDYSRLAKWRTTDRGQLAKVLGVAKPPKQVDGQESLFGEIA